MALNPYANPFIPKKRFVRASAQEPNAPDESSPTANWTTAIPRTSNNFGLGNQIASMFQSVAEADREKRVKSDFPFMKSVINKHADMGSIARGIAYPVAGRITNHAINAGSSLIGSAVTGIRDLIDQPKQAALQAASRLEQEKSDTRSRLATSQSQGRYVSYK